MTTNDIESLSYRELQAECRKASISSSGNTAKLRQRLRGKIEHEKNKMNQTSSTATDYDKENHDNEVCDPPKQKKRKSPVDDLICPITLELVFDPVTAQDGRTYERTAIEEYFKRGGSKSPYTNEPMGTRLIPNVQFRNLIETLIENGDVVGQLADSWKRKVQEKKEVDELVRKAENGDGAAAFELARVFAFGSKGVIENSETSNYWLIKSAEAGNHHGMALSAIHLARSRPSDAVAFVSMAAQAGVDHACITLGRWYRRGYYGLSKNKVLGKRLLEQAVNGHCIHKIAAESYINSARKLLLKL